MSLDIAHTLFLEGPEKEEEKTLLSNIGKYQRSRVTRGWGPWAEAARSGTLGLHDMIWQPGFGAVCWVQPCFLAPGPCPKSGTDRWLWSHVLGSGPDTLDQLCTLSCSSWGRGAPHGPRNMVAVGAGREGGSSGRANCPGSQSCGN